MNKYENHIKFPILLFVGIIGLLTSTRSFSQQSHDTTSTQEILKVGPYLQAPFNSGMTIRWVTNLPCYSWVMYGTSSSLLNQKAQTIKDGLIEANNRNNSIRLENLEPNTNYYYQIYSSVIQEFHPNKIVYGETYQSPIYTFSSVDPKKEEINFSVFNDVQGRPESFEYLLNYQGNPKKDFYFLNGDMYTFLTDENQMLDGLFSPLSKLFASETPFILVRGNHELRGKYSRQFMDYFDGKDGRFYYSFQRGDTYFIVLDSGEDKPDDAKVYGGLIDFDNYRLEQAEWLKREIEKPEYKKSKYKIVLSHIPLYYSNDWHGTTHIKEIWGPILNKGKIDLMISGHTHKYGMYPPVKGKHNFDIVIGGGLKDGTRTIINVEIDKENLHLQMFNDSGELVGNLNLK